MFGELLGRDSRLIGTVTGIPSKRPKEGHQVPFLMAIICVVGLCSILCVVGGVCSIHWQVGRIQETVNQILENQNAGADTDASGAVAPEESGIGYELGGRE